MRKILALLIVLFLVLVGTLFVLEASLETSFTKLYPDLSSESESLPYTHSSTKAICTEDNYCMDYEIICKNSKILEMRFTGAAVQFSQDWKDPRTLEQKEFC